MTNHGERKHSKFSASGAERWFNCSASVELSEGMPSRDSVWSIEGTKAHEVLEEVLRALIEHRGREARVGKQDPTIPAEMQRHAIDAANFIMRLHRLHSHSEIMVETRIYLDFIHPEMFGTFDGAVVDYFGTLHVFDYKYGKGYAVSPRKNLQMIFYGIGLAYRFHWNFKKVRLWIIQPRIKGYDGPVFWDLSIEELREYAKLFRAAVKRVLKSPELKEGPWCHWCNAKGKCPLKLEGRNEKAIAIFSGMPLLESQP